MSVRKRGKGWLIDIRQGRNGKRILHTFHGTEAEAWELEHAMKRELNRALPFDHKTVSTIVPDYLEYVRTHQSEVTYKSKKKMLFGHLMATFGNTFIDCIPDTLIQQYKTKRLTEIASKTATKGGNRAINLELLCLSAMVKWATKQYLKFEQLPVSKPMPMVLSREQVKAILDNMNPFYRTLFLCLYSTGMRKKEVLGLTWDRIDLDNDVIIVFGKGAHFRMVPIHPMLKEALCSHKKTQGGINLVFPSPKRKEDTPLVDLRRPIADAVKAAKIGRHVNPHLFRHTFATHILEETGDLRMVQELLGHQQITTTEIYTHIAQVHKKKGIEKGLF